MAPASAFGPTNLGNLLYQFGDRTRDHESRRSSARGPTLERRAWPIIERCAGAAVSLEPHLTTKP